VELDEIPVPPDGSLTSMSLGTLFEQVRAIGGRLGWIEGAVRVLGTLDVPIAVDVAVIEHQAELRLLVPHTPLSDLGTSLYRLRILGTEEEDRLRRGRGSGWKRCGGCMRKAMTTG
jgi:hypothetical protein